MSPPTLAAAILAGGRASRMGGADKSALRIGDGRILDRQLAVLRDVADPVAIVANDAAPFATLGVPVIPDVIAGAGPLAGILSALEWSPAPRTLVVACDMPFLTAALLRRLAAPSEADLVIPRGIRGYEPLCAVWSANAAAAIRQRLARGGRDVVGLVEELRVEEIGPEVLASCDPHGLLFVNVNTLHDYERAQELSRLEGKR